MPTLRPHPDKAPFSDYRPLSPSDTGEHIQDSGGALQYIPFPTCAETSAPLSLSYGIEAELNCTIDITDPLFHLLEFYIHNDAPLTCRLPARPAPTVTSIPGEEFEQEYVPLIFALAGVLQLSHLHVASHLNILLHSSPKHHLQKHDSGVIDSGAAYSTSPLSPETQKHKLVIGDTLPLRFSVRWFPTPALPTTNGKVEWAGMGGHVYASTLFYCVVSFGAGAVVVGTYLLGVVMPKRMRGRGLGGATPLAYGVGNGWGIGSKRMD
jgi:hypothetical protein